MHIGPWRQPPYNTFIDAVTEKRNLDSVDWAQICVVLSQYCQTQGGIQKALTLRPVLTAAAVVQQVELTAALQDIGGPALDLSLTGSDEVGRVLPHLESGRVGDPKQLSTLGHFLDVREQMGRLMQAPSHTHPVLSKQFPQSYDRMSLLRDIQDRISPHGEIYDDASPELRLLSRQEDQDRKAVQKRLDELVKKYGYQHMLMEHYVTLRDGRYVLPIKIEFHNQVKGVIHDVSNSRHTAFIEPFEIVKINNHLMQVLESKREACYKILRFLSDRVRDVGAEVAADLEQVFVWDLVAAKIKFGRKIQGQLIRPQVRGDKGASSFSLRDLKHPLLLHKGGAEVVGNDVVLDPNAKGLVISGPNMGGKTVLLKGIGCSVLMSHCGIPIACHPESQLPFISWIRWVIGDQQSLTEGVSSFTFQAEMLKSLPPKSVPATWMGLILVDEIMSATDPEEGEALAHAFLESWMAYDRLLVFVSTHYTHLKNLSALGKIPMTFGAMADEGGHPTYRFFQGSFGQSLGIDTAEAIGVPKSIIQQARKFVGGKSLKLGELTRLLQGKIQEVDQKLRQVSHEQAELAKQRVAVETREQNLDAEAKKLEATVTNQLWDEFEGLYREIREQLGKLRQKPKKEQLAHLQSKTADVIAQIRGRLANIASKHSPQMGGWYLLPHLGKVQVLEWREDKKYALVLCKNKKIRLSLEHFAKAKKV